MGPAVIEWLVPPVTVNVISCEAYRVPGVVESLQVAASLVVRDTVVLVVPDARVPEGEPLDRTGGVVSVPLDPITG